MIKANIAWSAKQIAKAVTKGSMVFDNAIQRGNVWNVVQQSLLIESLIHNYPVPPMYTIKTDIDAPAGCKKGSKGVRLLRWQAAMRSDSSILSQRICLDWSVLALVRLEW